LRERRVVLSPEAQTDLEAIYDFVADAATPTVALNYLDRLQGYCAAMALGSERGHRGDDVRPGLRIVGFERRITIAFTVSAEDVTILRIFYAGRNWEDEL
jgi:toxin ParE1/3/4